MFLGLNQRLTVDIAASQLVGPHQRLLIIHRAANITTPRDVQFLRLFAVCIEVMPVKGNTGRSEHPTIWCEQFLRQERTREWLSTGCVKAVPCIGIHCPHGPASERY